MSDKKSNRNVHAFDLLKKDHRLVEELFEKINKAGSEDKSLKLFEQLCDEISLHAELEEKLLYPRFEQARETRALAEESYKEHDKVKEMIEELKSLAPLSDRFNKKLDEMKDDQLAHIQKEEKELFPLGEKVLSEDELYELGSEIQKMKQEKLEKKMGTKTSAKSEEAKAGEDVKASA